MVSLFTGKRGRLNLRADHQKDIVQEAAVDAEAGTIVAMTDGGAAAGEGAAEIGAAAGAGAMTDIGVAAGEGEGTAETTEDLIVAIVAEGRLWSAVTSASTFSASPAQLPGKI